jgi:signal recognition particle subunit SEC65
MKKLKYVKLFENFQSINEKKEPRSEVDHKALYKVLNPVLDKDGKPVYDKESYEKLSSTKGKKLDLDRFIESERPRLDNLAEVLKKLEIGVHDESWANMVEHPVDIVNIQKYFVKSGFITNDQLAKMPDFQSNLNELIKSNTNTWNKTNYSKVEKNQNYDGDLFTVIQFLSSKK